MKRRAFITLVGGAAASAWPLPLSAQQAERMRRIGVLMAVAADDLQGQARLTAFVQGLQQLGWTDGRNLRIDTRWAAGDPDRLRRYAAELVALPPDAIFVSGGSGMAPMLQATRTVPIVFAQVTDPVGAGFVESLARPGGNATGFAQFASNMCAPTSGCCRIWLHSVEFKGPVLLRICSGMLILPMSCNSAPNSKMINASTPQPKARASCSA